MKSFYVPLIVLSALLTTTLGTLSAAEIENEVAAGVSRFTQENDDYFAKHPGTFEAMDKKYFSDTHRTTIPEQERKNVLALAIRSPEAFGELAMSNLAAPGIGRGGGCGGACWARTNNPLNCQDCVDTCCILTVPDPTNPPPSYQQCITAGYLICDVGILMTPVTLSF